MIKILSKQSVSAFLWLTFCISIFIFAVGLSWQLNKQVNFTYPMWYQVLEIEQHIQKYAPQNKYLKEDFVDTDSKQHYRLFAEVVNSINEQGKGLADITYMVNSRKVTLFTESEVVHLQDVSDLIDKLTIVWFINLLPLIALSILYLQQLLAMPSKTLKRNTLLVTIGIITSTFLLLGFNKIFYYFHTLVFPDNHQWFFYYQESLMSTFMKAPDLFAAIAVNLVLVTGIICSVFYFLIINKSKTVM